MQRLQAFKYELMPTGEQQRQMRRFAGSCRFVYNKALAMQKERYERGEKKLGYAGLCKLLTEWRNSPETAWLADAPVHPLQRALKDLERAYANFFAKRADFPRFKKKGLRDSFRYPDPKQIKLDQANSRLFLPKLGWLRYRNSRTVLGTVKNVTVSLSCGKWFVSIQTEREVEQPIPSGGAVGIDMGVARFATLSDGTFYAPLNSFKRHETALRKAQQAMSRKVKFSNNWKKAKARVQRIHSRIGNARRDYLHKTSAAISKNHAMVCIEDLQVRNMSKSAAGTADTPGRNVRAKSGLNKSILEQGWFEFRRQLDYKLAWKGGWLVAVPPQNTSRTCPCCGHAAAENRQTQAQFACVECGFEENADVVGAINALRAGHARFACEVSGAVMPPAAGTHRSDSGGFNAAPERRRNLGHSCRGGCQMYLRSFRGSAARLGAILRIIMATLMLVVTAPCIAAPLTLKEALATADAPHPQNRIAVANLELARADETLATSSNDMSISFSGGLRSGRPTIGPDRWTANNTGEVTLYKPLYDFGRTEHSVGAARDVVRAREEEVLDVRERRRLDIMARFFDVLLTDMRYTADNEYMAVAYVNWDDGRKRLEAGELSRAELARLESRYQEAKLRRDEDERQERLSRQLLADAMNQPGKLAADLERPKLISNGIELPEYERLLPVALAHNRRLLALDAEVAAARQRIYAARAEKNPSLGLEVKGGDFSRHTVTRDYASGGLVLSWPLYSGRAVDARVAAARAEEEKLLAQREEVRRSVANALLDALTEISWLRGSALPAARQNSDYRDTSLERARAEYEMEYRTNLGNAMADIQAASLRQGEVKYRLALALARVSALTGQSLEQLAADGKGGNS